MDLIKTSTHKARMDLAEEIFCKIMHEKKNEILAVGLYGSMAKHTDTPFSDIEFDVIPKEEDVNYSVSHIYKGIKYEICYISKNILIQNIRNPANIDWPKTISASLTAKPFYDPTNTFEEFKKEYNKIIKADFTPFYKDLFVDGIYESMCKFIKAVKHGDMSSVRFYAYHYLFDEFICFIAILNKTFINNAATRGVDSINMPINFNSYKVFARLLINGEVEKPDTLIESAFSVYKEIETFILSKNIKIETDEIIL